MIDRCILMGDNTTVSVFIFLNEHLLHGSLRQLNYHLMAIYDLFSNNIFKER